MWELFALVLYSVQWLGVVLGVGAQTVLLVGHLLALHSRQPQWLGGAASVRVAQGIGLWLIVGSGLGAIAYQIGVGHAEVLFISTFGFKWVLIALLVGFFFLERASTRGRTALEGFAGATWYGLFMVHSVAPIFLWVDLFFFYGVWTALFVLLWGISIWALKRRYGAAIPALQNTPAPVPPPRAAPKPVIKPAAAPSVARAAQVVSKAPQASVRPVPKPPVPTAPAPVSLWGRIMSLFIAAPNASLPEPQTRSIWSAPPQEAPPMAAVSAPIPLQNETLRAQRVPPPAPVPAPAAKPTSGVPAVEYLELEAPKQPAAAQPVHSDAYIPDYNNLPGVRIMPQRPEDLTKENRAPIVAAY